jgi:hypothetical protein
VLPDHLDVKVHGAPPVHVLYQEVGPKESEFHRVGGADYSNPDWRIRPLDLGTIGRPMAGGCGPWNTAPSNSIRILTARLPQLHTPQTAHHGDGSGSQGGSARSPGNPAVSHSPVPR